MNTIAEHAAIEAAHDRMSQAKALLEAVYADGVAAGRLLQKQEDTVDFQHMRKELEDVMESIAKNWNRSELEDE